MNSLGLTIMPARDGGLVVYANYDSEDQGLVLAGNVKEVNDYIAKQIGLLGTEAVKPIPETYSFKPSAHNRVDGAFRLIEADA